MEGRFSKDRGNVGSAWTLLAPLSSHQKALDTFPGQKASPSIIPLSAEMLLTAGNEWEFVWMEGGRGAASSSAVPLGPG